MSKPIQTTVFGEVLKVPALRSGDSICHGCVANDAPGCHTLFCDSNVIFIKNTPEAIADYVKQRMTQ